MTPLFLAVSSHPFPYTNLISRSGVCLIMVARRWSCTPHYLPFPCLLLLLDTLFAYISILFIVVLCLCLHLLLLCFASVRPLPWWETGIRERGFFRTSWANGRNISFYSFAIAFFFINVHQTYGFLFSVYLLVFKSGSY